MLFREREILDELQLIHEALAVMIKNTAETGTLEHLDDITSIQSTYPVQRSSIRKLKGNTE